LGLALIRVRVSSGRTLSLTSSTSSRLNMFLRPRCDATLPPEGAPVGATLPGYRDGPRLSMRTNPYSHGREYLAPPSRLPRSG
jgi:hypothetical protein